MPTFLFELDRQITQCYQSFTTYHLMLLDDQRASYSFTSANISGSTFTVPGHTYINGTRVVLGVTGGSLPTPLAVGSFASSLTKGVYAITGSVYFVVNQSGNTFQLATTSGGSSITLSGTLTGTATIQDVPVDANVTTVTELVRKEVATYQGIANRPTYNPGSTVTRDGVNGRVSLPTQSIELNNTSGGGSVIYTTAVLIRNGTNSRGNTSGNVDSFFAFGGAQTIAPGQIQSIQIPNIFSNG